jgi:hypothetical protein
VQAQADARSTHTSHGRDANRVGVHASHGLGRLSHHSNFGSNGSSGVDQKTRRLLSRARWTAQISQAPTGQTGGMRRIIVVPCQVDRQPARSGRKTTVSVRTAQPGGSAQSYDLVSLQRARHQFRPADRGFDVVRIQLSLSSPSAFAEG